MDYLFLAIFSFCAGFALCYWLGVRPLQKKVKELQKRLVDGIKREVK